MTTPEPDREIIEALTPLFAANASVTTDQLTAIVASLDAPDAKPLLSACCRAVALRSLITAASQSNNAEAARRAAMTLLERFTESETAALDHPAAIAHTRRLLAQTTDPDTDQPAEDHPDA